MHKEEKIKVGISIGDLNGIGGELIIKTFEDSRVLDFCTPIVFASAKTFTFLKKHFKSEIRFNGIYDLNKMVHGKINVINVWKEHVDINFGVEDQKIGKYAIRSFTAATKALKEGKVDVLLTAPINKHNIQSEDFNFPGHTDYLNQELEGQSLMFMVTNSLKVGLLTDHIPVKDIANNITEDLILSKINTINQTLVKDFAIRRPKIALLGINPHTGDNGVIGEEDDTLLRPAIKKAQDEGTLVFGPYSADSFFGSDNYKNFDAVLAAYHDQGLIPFKTLSFGQGVNFTAGLNKVRTSPDHGTAYEIAGKGVADINSFKEALFYGIQIYKNRQMYDDISKNPLKKHRQKS
ncbi:MAG: 4-hydroxythreonine-4-phosphate dehydrogenase PdxA [Flavobacteriaceae bacterium]|nr:4-hydroxythreonine-4-phosphate dehydrogenase PdxA [Flavobacteriaceae bacterium]